MARKCQRWPPWVRSGRTRRGRPGWDSGRQQQRQKGDCRGEIIVILSQNLDDNVQETKDCNINFLRMKIIFLT